MLHCYLAVVIIVYIQFMCSTFVREEWNSFKDNLRGYWLQSSWDDHQKVLYFGFYVQPINIFSDIVSILCFLHQLVACFCLSGVSAFQTEEVQVSHYTIFYCLLRGCWSRVGCFCSLLSNLKERKELLHLEKEQRETQPKRDDVKSKVQSHFC